MQQFSEIGGCNSFTAHNVYNEKSRQSLYVKQKHSIFSRLLYRYFDVNKLICTYSKSGAINHNPPIFIR